jgi:hypothetical protein
MCCTEDKGAEPRALAKAVRPSTLEEPAPADTEVNTPRVDQDVAAVAEGEQVGR